MSEIVTIAAQKAAEQASDLATQYENYQITTPQSYSSAGDDLKLIKTKVKELDDLRKSMTKPLDESKKQIMDFFRKPLEFLTKAESSVKTAMLNWQREQQRIAREEQRRLEEQQRKEAEKLRRRAEKAAEKGKEEKAEELIGQAAVVEASQPIVAPKVEQIKGIQTKTVWKYRILDADLIPRQYLIPNETMLGQIARSTKGALQIDGVEFYSEETIASGRF